MSIEQNFALEELFFSTTDRNGKILSGNQVFARVAEYEMDELIGKPHRIIRHPDMPRAVFRLLWTEIERGNSIAAYVKNRSKNGKYYWVMALVTPIEEVYLSVRFKPTGGYLELVEKLYAEMLQVEHQIESSPDGTKEKAITASTSHMLERLLQLGFNSYAQFIERAFYDEYWQRTIKLKRQGDTPQSSTLRTPPPMLELSRFLDSIMAYHDQYKEVSSKVLQTTTSVAELAHNVQLASLNLTVKCKREQQRGQPLAVISNWLKRGASFLETQLSTVLEPIKRDLESLEATLFSVVATKLQLEMVTMFAEEMQANTSRKNEARAQEAEIALGLLQSNCQRIFHTCLDAFETLTLGIKRIKLAFNELQRDVMALGMAQVTGLTESCRLTNPESFSIILQGAMSEIQNAGSAVVQLETTLENLTRFLDSSLQHGRSIDFSESTPILLTDNSVIVEHNDQDSISSQVQSCY